MSYVCGCTAVLDSEDAVQSHVKVCELLGYPAHPTTCRGTIGLDNPGHLPARVCGEPAIKGAPCERHLAERERLL